MMSDEIPITIITSDCDEKEDFDASSKGWSDEIRGRLDKLKEVKLNAADLEKNMSSFLKLVNRIFRQAESDVDKNSQLQLDEIEVSVEISAEGEVKLVAGGKMTGKGAIKLKFKRIS